MKAFRLFTGHATSAKVLPPDLRAELPEIDEGELLLQGRAQGAARRALATLQGIARAAAPGRQARHGALPVRALAAAQSRRPCARRPLRRDDAGLHRQRRVQEPDLVRRRAPRPDARLRARAQRRPHRGRRAAGLPQQRAAGLGVDAHRLRAGPPARSQPRDLEHQGRDGRLASASTTTIPTPSSTRSPRASSGSRRRPSPPTS